VDAAYEKWLDRYGDWTRADAEAAGYQVAPECVDAATEGLPADLGAMGFHAFHPVYATDGVLDPEQPDLLLLDGDDRVVGVEYEAAEVTDPAPEIVPGLPLEFTPPHPGVDHDHMSRHIWFVGDEADRFKTWNPAFSCPEGSTAAAMAHAQSEDEAGEMAESHDEGTATDDEHVANAPAMPETGAGDLLEGGTTSLLLLLATAMALAGVAGAWMARRA
jgi:hypothetical protein